MTSCLFQLLVKPHKVLMKKLKENRNDLTNGDTQTTLTKERLWISGEKIRTKQNRGQSSAALAHKTKLFLMIREEAVT